MRQASGIIRDMAENLQEIPISIIQDFPAARMVLPIVSDYLRTKLVEDYAEGKIGFPDEYYLSFMQTDAHSKRLSISHRAFLIGVAQLAVHTFADLYKQEVGQMHQDKDYVTYYRQGIKFFAILQSLILGVPTGAYGFSLDPDRYALDDFKIIGLGLIGRNEESLKRMRTHLLFEGVPIRILGKGADDIGEFIVTFDPGLDE